MKNKNKRKIIVFSGPSGAGKTTIARYIEKKNKNLEFSISATTRKKRADETHGKDYYFVSQQKFRNLIQEGKLIEWEEVYSGLYYGTLKSEIERIRKEGKYSVLDVDVMGALNIKKLYPKSSFIILVAPTSIQELKKRLEKRGTESELELKKRISKAKKELSYKNKFDAVIINKQDKLEKSITQAKELVKNFLKK